MEFVFNVLVAAQGSPDLPLYTTADRIDRLFNWLVTSQWEVIKIFIVISVIGIMVRNKTIYDIGISGGLILLFTLLMLGQRSIEESFNAGIVRADMAYVKVLLIGCLMLFSLKLNPKGLIPEVPFRPKPHVNNSSHRFFSDNLKGDDKE